MTDSKKLVEVEKSADSESSLKMHEDEQYLLFGIEIHELLYCLIMKIAKVDVKGPEAWRFYCSH
ncbi:hypothetical protein EA766_04800 [Acinetobacter pittii]|nr:hypothetical protein EA766_04800 [Acinetobacter pittii]